METIIQKAAKFVETETLRLAAQNLQHLININEEKVTLENIVTSIQKTMASAKDSTPEDLHDILATQVRILDGAFLHFMDASNKKPYTETDKVDMALKAQKQMLSTVNTIRHLKNTSLKELEKNRKIQKQTEQKERPATPNA